MTQYIRDPKWERLPVLREALEGLRLGDHHHGPLSAVRQIGELLEIAYVTVDNEDKIRALDREPATRDVVNIIEALRGGGDIIQRLGGEMDDLLRHLASLADSMKRDQGETTS